MVNSNLKDIDKDMSQNKKLHVEILPQLLQKKNVCNNRHILLNAGKYSVLTFLLSDESFGEFKNSVVIQQDNVTSMVNKCIVNV